MKKDIQPQVYTDCKVACACGTSFVTISTQKGISVEICSKCHPFFTGQQRFVDTEGRIDTFEKKAKLMAAKKQKAMEIKEAKQVRAKKASTKTADKQPTLKDILAKEEN
jgi:large subunit ribosomal protein L31